MCPIEHSLGADKSNSWGKISVQSTEVVTRVVLLIRGSFGRRMCLELSDISVKIELDVITDV